MSEIVTELLPKVDLLHDDVIVYCVVATERIKEHDESTFTIICVKYLKDDYYPDRIIHDLPKIPGFRLLGCFSDRMNAEEFLYWSLERESRLYTATLKDLSEVRDRPFVAYFGDDLTVHPGMYLIRKCDWNRLKEVFSSVRLANAEELFSDREVLFSVMVKDFERMKTLGMKKLHCIRANSKWSSSDTVDVCTSFTRSLNMWETIKKLCIIHVRGDSRFDRQSILNSVMLMFPDSKRAERILNRLVQWAQSVIAAGEAMTRSESSPEVYDAKLTICLKGSEIEYC